MKGASHIAPLGVRLPEDLKTKLQERAKRNGRSMNSEIVQILEDALNANIPRHVVIPDEAHHSSGEVTFDVKRLEEIMEKVVSKAFVGLTATPIDKKR